MHTFKIEISNAPPSERKYDDAAEFLVRILNSDNSVANTGCGFTYHEDARRYADGIACGFRMARISFAFLDRAYDAETEEREAEIEGDRAARETEREEMSCTMEGF